MSDFCSTPKYVGFVKVNCAPRYCDLHGSVVTCFPVTSSGNMVASCIADFSDKMNAAIMRFKGKTVNLFACRTVIRSLIRKMEIYPQASCKRNSSHFPILATVSWPVGFLNNSYTYLLITWKQSKMIWELVSRSHSAWRSGMRDWNHSLLIVFSAIPSFRRCS